MSPSKRVGFIFALTLALPFFMACQFLATSLARNLLAGDHALLAAMPKLPENLGRTFWLGIELLPLLIWKNWRDISALRLGWTWAVLVPATVAVMHLGGFGKLPAHPWLGSFDLLWLNLLVGANEEVIFRGYMFHDLPEAHPKTTVFWSSVTFALFHYVNLGVNDNFRGITIQVVAAFLAGLTYGVVRLATGSLGWCILLHWWEDAAFDFNAFGTYRSNLAGISLLPVWILLALILFAAHPVMRVVPAGGPAVAATPGRRRWLRWTMVTLLGLPGGLAILLAVVWQLGVSRELNKLPPVVVIALFGLVVLPSFLLAVSTAYWPRWRALSWKRTYHFLCSPDDPTPPELRPVRLGAALLFYVTLLVVLCLALVCTGKINVTLPPAHDWQTFRANSLFFGLAAILLVPPPLLLLFSLWAAISPRSSRRMTMVWMGVAVYQIFLVWLGVVGMPMEMTASYGLKLSMWNFGVVGLLLSLFLALRQPFLPRRFDWMLPVAVVYLLLLFTRPLVSPLLDGWLQEHFSSDAFADYSTDLAWAIVETALLLLVLAPALLWKSLRSLGTLRLRLSWTVLLLLPVPILNLVFLEGWPPGNSRPDTACQLWDFLVVGVMQETVYRGYLFHGSPQKHPRFVVLFSAVAYACINLTLLPDNAPAELVQQTVLMLVFGLALGIVRLVTGSLGWCLLAAVLVSVTDDSVNADGWYSVAAWAVAAVGGLAAVAILWRHPAFRRAVVAEPPTESLADVLIPALPLEEPGL